MQDSFADLEDNSPETLVSICTEFCVNHLETFCDWDYQEKRYVLRSGLSLPNEICEGMLNKCCSMDSSRVDGDFLKLFSNPLNTRLKRVSLRNCDFVTDDDLAIVLSHGLLELDITNCLNITQQTYEHINNNGEDLISLVIGNSVNILPETLAEDEPCSSKRRTCILNTPNLKRLVIKNWEELLEADYLSLLFQPLPHLTHLDLSGCQCLGNLSELVHLSELVSLVLYGVPGLPGAIQNICQLKNLRHLDISQHAEKLSVFSNPNQVLATIVQSLPHLSSLDISGTNLAGTGIAEPDGMEDEKECTYIKENMRRMTDIPGLRTRVTRPLNFLGLLNTTNDACHRVHIPAIRVTGDANERQILTAAQAYIDRPEVLQKVLNDLFRLFRYERCHNSKLALKLILQAMQQHLIEKHIQISGSASLFYIVKGDERTSLNIKVKKCIIKTLLDGMCQYQTDPTMMRNGCLTLCNFRIPQDVMFDYRRLVTIVLRIVAIHDQEEFVQRIGIYLLNSLVCQVEGYQKQLVGELGAIETMLMLIDERLRRQLCDEVMEIAWSTMWNVTDETPVNCKRFLDDNGMYYFLKCLEVFPDKPELLRNIMGLLGNVAEVDFLRPFLMKSKYLNVFCSLLDSSSDGIEVSYNAAGVLAHIASDGKTCWTESSPDRQEVLDRMIAAIERWDIDTKRNINYRSFEPIFRLLKVSHTPETQYWAVWALANLTRVYPDKYCPLVKEEGGIELLKGLKTSSTQLRYKQIETYAQMVVTQCEVYGSLMDAFEHDTSDSTA